MTREHLIKEFKFIHQISNQEFDTEKEREHLYLKAIEDYELSRQQELDLLKQENEKLIGDISIVVSQRDYLLKDQKVKFEKNEKLEKSKHDAVNLLNILNNQQKSEIESLKEKLKEFTK